MGEGNRAGARLCDVLALLEPAAPLVGPFAADVMNTMARAGRVAIPRGPGGGREEGEDEGGAHSGRLLLKLLGGYSLIFA